MNHGSRQRPWTLILALIFIIDRLIKYAAVIHFFRRLPPPAPPSWPTVSMIQPLTRGVATLHHNLVSRFKSDYPAHVEHVLIYDQGNVEIWSTCQAALAECPGADVRLIAVDPAQGSVATKLEKLNAGLSMASGAVLCFIDDDVALRSGALQTLIAHLEQPHAGAAFGLACYTNWSNIWSGLLSSFVNSNVLLSYIPLAYLTEPYTITGHCFVLKQAVFSAIGGLSGIDSRRIDDDHELARRVQRHGLRNIQTPLVYDVNNQLDDLGAYANQMQRWFVFPRVTMLPYLTAYNRMVTAVGGLGTLLPGLAALQVLASGGRRGGIGLISMLGGVTLIYVHTVKSYLGHPVRLSHLPLIWLSAVLAPWQIVRGLLAGDEILWRGQRLRVRAGQPAEVLS